MGATRYTRRTCENTSNRIKTPGFIPLFYVRRPVSKENDAAREIHLTLSRAVKEAAHEGRIPRDLSKFCNIIQPHTLGITLLEGNKMVRGMQYLPVNEKPKPERVTEVAVNLQQKLAELALTHPHTLNYKLGRVRAFGDCADKASYLSALPKGWRDRRSLQHRGGNPNGGGMTTAILGEEVSLSVKSMVANLPVPKHFIHDKNTWVPHLSLLEKSGGLRAHEIDALTPVLEDALPAKVPLANATIYLRTHPGDRRVLEATPDVLELNQPTLAVPEEGVFDWDAWDRERENSRAA